jgi:hypothetical protein
MQEVDFEKSSFHLHKKQFPQPDGRSLDQS